MYDLYPERNHYIVINIDRGIASNSEKANLSKLGHYKLNDSKV